MWLMAPEVAIRLDILDQTGLRLFSAAGRLKHLDDTFAEVIVDSSELNSGLHWGAPVRFEVEDGMRRYELTGAIVAHSRRSPATASEAQLTEQAQDVRIRLWECKLNVQRRSLPRRKLKFPVRFRVLCPGEAPGEDYVGTEQSVNGWCVDIGAGGIRLRTEPLPAVPSRILVEFALPVRQPCAESEGTHNFSLAGRVIRAEPCGRHLDDLEIAVRFERLSVKDGMILDTLLS